MSQVTPSHLAPRQQGVALIVVMVLLLLATIIVLGSSRTGWFTQLIVSSESDQQRTFAAAEALIRDAELDIRGVQTDGITRCQAAASFVGCRDFGSGDVFLPQEDSDLDLIATRLTAGGAVNTCLDGICLPSTVNDLQKTNWDTPAALAAMTPVGATYGQYTGAAPAAAGNPILSAIPPQGWYWIEVFRYTEASAIVSVAGNVPIPDRKTPYIYRITAYAQGLKPGTRIWLRSIFVPKPQNQIS